MVRARWASHLTWAFPGSKVSHTPTADYQYRVTVTRKRWVKFVAKCAEGIDYSNFKNAIPLGEDEYHRACGLVWAALRRASGAAVYGAGMVAPVYENYHEDDGFAYSFVAGEDAACNGDCLYCESWKDVEGCPQREADLEVRRRFQEEDRFKNEEDGP